jgi:hypothetical protein
MVEAKNYLFNCFLLFPQMTQALFRVVSNLVRKLKATINSLS